MSEFTGAVNNFDRWAGALEETDPATAQLLRVNKPEVTATLDSLQLPRCGLYELKASEAQQLADIPECITSEYVVWHMLPSNPSDERVVRLKVPREDALRRLREDVTGLGERANKYSILLSDYFENEYGGNIEVTADGNVLVAFGEGFQGDYAAGEKPEQYQVVNDIYTKNLIYPFENEELRAAIWDTVSSVWKSPETSAPGYYEFTLYRNGYGALRPVFFDARLGESAFNRIPAKTFRSLGQNALLGKLDKHLTKSLDRTILELCVEHDVTIDEIGVEVADDGRHIGTPGIAETVITQQLLEMLTGNQEFTLLARYENELAGYKGDRITASLALRMHDVLATEAMEAAQHQNEDEETIRELRKKIKATTPGKE